MTVTDPEYSPNPYAHAVRHLDEAEDAFKDYMEIAEANERNTPLALLIEKARMNLGLSIGWALLAIARKR